MLQRFVITEFFRTPNEVFETSEMLEKIWYYKNTIILKRFQKIHPRYIRDIYYDETGHIHRDYDQPAIITTEGEEHYYYHGKPHRGHFEPAIIRKDGTKEYWVYGEKRFKTMSAF